MGQIQGGFGSTFRDYETDNVPSSGPHKVRKSDAQALGALIENAIASTGSNLREYATIALRDAGGPFTTGQLVRVYRNNGSAADPANGYYQWTGGGFESATWFFNGANAAALAAVAEVSDTAKGAIEGVAVVLKASVAFPKGGNASTLRALVADTSPGVRFKLLFVANTTTENVTLEAGGRTGPIVNSGAQPWPVGTFTRAKIADVEYSDGGSFVASNIVDYAATSTSKAIGSDDPGLRDTPFGVVSFAGQTRNVAPLQRYVAVIGSSNAHPDYVGAAYLPATVAARVIDSRIPGGEYAVIGETQAQPGAPMVTIMSQLMASQPLALGGCKWVLDFYWMNDARTLFYHSQGGIRAELNAYAAGIDYVQSKGAEFVGSTGFHPDMRAPGVALDPNYFTDAPTANMDSPTFKAAPVNPETQMWPPASAVLTAPQDFSGSGILRTGYKRVWHVNREKRRILREKGCVCLDFEVGSFRGAIETVPDLSAGLETFYTTGNPLHPKDALYAAGVVPVMEQWGLAVSQGRTDKRVFTGY